MLSTIQSLEDDIPSTSADACSLEADGGAYSRDANAVHGRIFLIDKAFSAVTSDRWHGHPGVWEASYRMLQAAALILMSVFLLNELL